MSQGEFGMKGSEKTDTTSSESIVNRVRSRARKIKERHELHRKSSWYRCPDCNSVLNAKDHGRVIPPGAPNKLPGVYYRCRECWNRDLRPWDLVETEVEEIDKFSHLHDMPSFDRKVATIDWGYNVLVGLVLLEVLVLAVGVGMGLAA